MSQQQKTNTTNNPSTRTTNTSTYNNSYPTIPVVIDGEILHLRQLTKDEWENDLDWGTSSSESD